MAADRLIRELNLGRYYEMRTEPALAPFAHIDDGWVGGQEFMKIYGRVISSGQIEVRSQIKGLRCFACVWLLERTAQKVAPSADVCISLGEESARIICPADGPELRDIALAYARLGYQLLPLAPGAKTERSDDLLRVGVAAFCALNVMSFALADYFAVAPLDPYLTVLFRWLSLALATFSLSYAAAPIFRGAWASLRNFRPGIDAGVAAALAAGFIYSAVHVVLGSGQVYFDSVSAIVALLLLGRFLQKKAFLFAQRQVYAEDQTSHVRLLHANGGLTSIPVQKIKVGDYLRLLPGETCAVAGSVVAEPEEEVEVSLAQVTGEPQFDLVRGGTRLRAGSVVGARPITIIALENGFGCYLTEAQRTAERLLGEKGRLTTLADKLAGYFFALTILVAGGTLAVNLASGSGEDAVQRFIAVLLVACPCVFGFAAPLALATSGARALRRGVAFRTQAAIEGLAAAKTIVFDKTGTLTTGLSMVGSANRLENHAPISDAEMRAFFTAAATRSSHHAARAVASWAEAALPEVSETELASGLCLEETFGRGISGTGFGHILRLGRADFVVHEKSNPQHKGSARGLREPSLGSGVFASIDGDLVWSFKLVDQLRPEARAVVSTLKELGLQVQMMSGDQSGATFYLARELGIEAWKGDLSPAGKALAVAKLKRNGSGVVMVGNGFNDSLAMGRARVGVAVHDASPYAKSVADIALLTPSLMAIVSAVELARAATRAIYRCFAFSATYNFCAMILATQGLISPVVAALLMPANSLTVTILATKWSGRHAQERAAADVRGAS